MLSIRRQARYRRALHRALREIESAQRASIEGLRAEIADMRSEWAPEQVSAADPESGWRELPPMTRALAEG